MADTSSFNFVPGFDFLQSMVKNAGAALPSMGQWVVPTLDPAELERRIEELRTVQFWLDQNSRMLTTTIQALEVQRMTLSTLKGMNVTVNELHEALKVRVPAAPPAPAAEPPAKAGPAGPATDSANGEADASTAAAGAVDAMQWWTALTQQFTQIASQAMQAAAQAVPETPPAVASKAAAKRPAPAGSAKVDVGAAGAARASPAKPILVKRASPRAKSAAPKS